MRLAVVATCIGLLLSTTANSKEPEIKRGPVPDWVHVSEPMAVPDNAAGMIFLRQQDSLIHFDEHGEAQYSGIRVKILHPNALQLGNLGFTWNPASGQPMVHAVKIYRDGQVIDILANSSFEILRREDQLEASVLTGKLTAVLAVPDLRVGDELEVSYTIRDENPTLGSSDSGFLFLAPAPPPGRIHLGMSWIDGQKPLIRISSDLAAQAVEGDKRVDFRFDNPPASASPKDAPGRFLWRRVAEYSDFPDWQTVSRKFAALFANAERLTPNSPLKQEAARIAASKPGELERATAALQLVQSNVRYVFVGLDGGDYEPAGADETWNRRYGDCKGKTALLLSLLLEIGIKAEPILINSSGNDDGLDERLPSPHMFDHVLVRAHLDGKVYFLDGTLPPVARPSDATFQPIRWILPLTTQGNALERFEWKMLDKPREIHLFEIDASAGFDAPARITSTTIFRGMQGLESQVQFSSLTPDQLLAAIQQNWTGDVWQTIDSAEWHYDEGALASVLKVSGTGKVNWENDGGDKRSLSLPGGGFSPPERRVRPADQDQTIPFSNEARFNCHVTTVHLPKSTTASQWSYNTAYDTHIFGLEYYRAFEMRGDTIRMVRSSRTESPEIDAATASADNERIAGFDNSMAWIIFNPAGHKLSTNSASVPATYEIDWARDGSSCLAATK